MKNDDIIKKTCLAGIGLISLIDERIKKSMKVWVKKGEKVEKEGKKAVSELKEKFEDLRKDFEKKIEIQVNKMIEKLNLPTKDDLEVLKKKVEELEKKLENK